MGKCYQKCEHGHDPTSCWKCAEKNKTLQGSEIRALESDNTALKKENKLLKGICKEFVCGKEDPLYDLATATTRAEKAEADLVALAEKVERLKIQYEREAAQGDKFADIIERIASEGKKDRARAETAEADLAALVEKVERLEGELETAMETLTVVYGKFPDVRYIITKAAEKAGKS